MTHVLTASELSSIGPQALRDALAQAGGSLCARRAFSSLSQFEAWSNTFFAKFHDPGGRPAWTGDALDGHSSRPAPGRTLLGHAEAYYRPCLAPPDVCLFWCETAPSGLGGQTVLVNAAALADALPTDLIERLETRQIIYKAQWAPGRWQAEFHVVDLVALKSLLDQDPRCHYSLDGDETLHLLYTANPIVTGPDGERLFLNGMLAHLGELTHRRHAEDVICKPHNDVLWGDTQTRIEAETINAIIDAHDTLAVHHQWFDGDLLIVDNHRWLHGRSASRSRDDRRLFTRFGYWRA